MKNSFVWDATCHHIFPTQPLHKHRCVGVDMCLLLFSLPLLSSAKPFSAVNKTMPTHESTDTTLS